MCELLSVRYQISSGQANIPYHIIMPVWADSSMPFYEVYETKYQSFHIICFVSHSFLIFVPVKYHCCTDAFQIIK